MASITSQMRDQAGVLILVFVMLVLILTLWLFRNDRDIVLSVTQWIAADVGGILGVVTGRYQAAQKAETINNTETKVGQ